MNKSILIIDKDVEVRKFLHQVLQVEEYEVNLGSNTENIENILEEISSKRPDLIILGLDSSNADWLHICWQLKNNLQTAKIPVLILSSRQDEQDIVSGLELGAEDYITKPFSPFMLLTRIDNILIHNYKNTSHKQNIVYYEDLIINPQKFEVRHLGRSIPVTRSEFYTLYCLFSRPGIVLTRKKILEAIHGCETPVSVRSIDVMLVKLRQQLGAQGKLIETVRGVGYRVKEVKKKTEQGVPHKEYAVKSI